jgi:hypothetical protein
MLIYEYSKAGFYDADASTRTQIKILLNQLLANTLQGADIIVCTVAAAANLRNNFNLTVVYIDESARLPKLKNLILLGVYYPRAFILAADHKQIRPTVLSVDHYQSIMTIRPTLTYSRTRSYSLCLSV